MKGIYFSGGARDKVRIYGTRKDSALTDAEYPAKRQILITNSLTQTENKLG